MLTLKLVPVQLHNFQQFQLADLNWNRTCGRPIEMREQSALSESAFVQWRNSHTLGDSNSRRDELLELNAIRRVDMVGFQRPTALSRL